MIFVPMYIITDRRNDPYQYDVTPPNTPRPPHVVTPRDVNVNEPAHMRYRDMQFWGLSKTPNSMAPPGTNYPL